MTDEVKPGLKQMTLQRLDHDDKYKKVLSAVDEETRRRIDAIVRGFVGELSDELSKLAEPEVRKRLMELMKDG